LDVEQIRMHISHCEQQWECCCICVRCAYDG